MGACHVLGSYSEKSISIFTKIQQRAIISRRGSIIYVDLIWAKIHNFKKIFGKWKLFFSQNSPQNRILETSIRHKSSEKGPPTFSSKIPERVDVETIKWHTTVRKYHE